MIRSAYLIARRDFVERGRSKVFIGVLLLLATAAIGIPFVVQQLSGDDEPQPIVVVLGGEGPTTLVQDITGAGESMGIDVQVRELTAPADAEALVQSGEADVGLLNGDTVITVGWPNWGEEAVVTQGTAAAHRRIVAAELGLSGADVARLVEPVQLDFVDLDPDTAETREEAARGVVAFLGVVVLFMSILLFGQMVASGVVEEKQNRVAEVVLAQASPESMLLGKVVGIGSLGLIQVLTVGLATVVGFRLFPPDFGAGVGAVGVGAVFWMVLWFVVGFLMYASFYAMLGATVSRQEDLQSIAFIPTIILIVPYFMMTFSLGAGLGGWFAPSSWFPFWSPLLMPFRLVTGDAGLWEAAGTLTLSVALAAFLIWLGGRVYHGAALRTGGRVSLREAVRSH